MSDKKGAAPWATNQAKDLLAPFLDSNDRVQNVELLESAVAMALDAAYERGLEAGKLTVRSPRDHPNDQP